MFNLVSDVADTTALLTNETKLSKEFDWLQTIYLKSSLLQKRGRMNEILAIISSQFAFQSILGDSEIYC